MPHHHRNINREAVSSSSRDSFIYTKASPGGDLFCVTREEGWKSWIEISVEHEWMVMVNERMATDFTVHNNCNYYHGSKFLLYLIVFLAGLNLQRVPVTQ